MTLQKQNSSATIEIEIGLDFILNHLDQNRLFPRTIMTKKLGYQKEVFSKQETMRCFIDSDFVDCRINAFPSYTEYKGIQRYPPDLIFIDLDRKDFKIDLSFENALSNTLKNIKQKLDNFTHPTVLKTGGGYHIILPIECTIVLENVREFKKYENYKPSQEFLRFAKDFLSDCKADKNSYPSFKSCLLRIPGSINSKYVNKVTIVQKWDGYRPTLQLELLLDFKRYLRQKNHSSRRTLLNSQIRSNNKVNNYPNNSTYYGWIERILQIPFEDCRKIISSLILAPYLINIKKLSIEESFDILIEWLQKCNSIRKLDFNLGYLVKAALNTANKKRIPPMKLETLRTKNLELFSILQKL